MSRQGQVPDIPAIQSVIRAYTFSPCARVVVPFQVLDEVFLAYDSESVHRVIFIETILTMIFLQWLPRENIA